MHTLELEEDGNGDSRCEVRVFVNAGVQALQVAEEDMLLVAGAFTRRTEFNKKTRKYPHEVYPEPF